MALDYDTQVELIFPPVLYQDAVCGPVLEQMGLPMEAAGNKMLLFTNADTVSALGRADDTVKEAMRKSNIGLVQFGWNADGRRTFLFDALRKIARDYRDDANARRLAAFDLHRFVHEGFLDRLSPNPFKGPATAGAGEPFDVFAALMFMVTPGQMNKPKAPDHLQASQARKPAGMFGKIFGKRQNPPAV